MEEFRDIEIEARVERLLTRLAFLRVSLAAAGGIAFAGFVTSGATAARAADLDGFVRASQLVTGVDRLPVALAPKYLKALDDAGLPLAPTHFVRLAGFADGRGPVTLAALERSSAFRHRGGKQAAEAIAAAWWSGMVPTRHGTQHVVTYQDALVWKALPYAEPPSVCLGATTAWSTPGRRLS